MLPALLAIGGGGWLISKMTKKKGMTPDRDKIYQEAMKNVRDGDKLRALAIVYDKEGLTNEADMLRKRAALREQPEEAKKARREAFKKTMSSTDHDGIIKVAEEFEKVGATGAAEALRTYAGTLKAPTPSPLN